MDVVIIVYIITDNIRQYILPALLQMNSKKKRIQFVKGNKIEL